MPNCLFTVPVSIYAQNHSKYLQYAKHEKVRIFWERHEKGEKQNKFEIHEDVFASDGVFSEKQAS